MKTRVSLACIVLVLGMPPSVVSAQAGTGDRRIASHRAAYQSIVNDFPRMRRVEADMDSLGLERMSTEGGTLEAYCSGRTLRLVIAHYNGEYGRGVERFYYKDDRLFFILDRSEFSDRLYGPTVRREEERLYFSAGALVRWLGTSGRAKSTSTAEARKRSEEAIELGSLFANAVARCEPRLRPIE